MQNVKPVKSLLNPLQSESDDIKNKAYDYAVFLLNLRLRTEGELREKLKSKPARGGSAFGGNYNNRIIDEVIQQLKDQRYVDDQNYAEVYLENLKRYKNFGYYGIKKKLMERKLPMSIIERVLLAGLSEEEEMKIAKRFLTKENVIVRSRATKQSTPHQRPPRFLAGMKALSRRLSVRGSALGNNAPQSSSGAIGSCRWGSTNTDRRASLAMTERQRLAQKLRARGFRSDVIAKLIFS